MTTERPDHDAETGAFASNVHEVHRGAGELRLPFRDGDVVVCLNDADCLRALHLQNVRDDTAAAARIAADGFLERFKDAVGVSTRARLATAESVLEARVKGYLYHERLEASHWELCQYIRESAARRGLTEQLGDEASVKWTEGFYPRKMLRSTNHKPLFLLRFVDDGVETVTGFD
jgi:hypothetical protein